MAGTAQKFFKYDSTAAMIRKVKEKWSHHTTLQTRTK
jgi:hypothetical protein